MLDQGMMVWKGEKSEVVPIVKLIFFHLVVETLIAILIKEDYIIAICHIRFLYDGIAYLALNSNWCNIIFFIEEVVLN